MARPTVRTSALVRDDVRLMKELFGSIANAYRILELHPSVVPMSEFRRAMSNLEVRPEQADDITRRWDQWRRTFLRPGDVFGFTLSQGVQQ